MNATSSDPCRPALDVTELRSSHESATSMSADVARARQFADIATSIAAQHTTSAAQERIVSLAAKTVGCAGACITELSRHGRVTVSATTNPAVLATAAAIANKIGHSVTSVVMTERATVISNDIAADPRWPQYGPKLAAAGPVRSTASFYLGIAEVPLGVLSFFGTCTDFFTPSVIEVCEIFVDHAVIGLVSASNADHADGMVHALRHSRIIGMAMGMLITTHGVDQDTAFDLLRVVSSRTNRKLHVVAEAVVETGDLPEGSLGQT